MQRLLVGFVIALVLVCTSGFSAFAADRFSTSVVVPFDLVRGNMIVVKCSVGGLRDLTAIVDTGTSETVLDIEVVRKLSLATEPDSATFVTQQAKVEAVAIPGLQLGPVRVDQLQGIATDLSYWTAELGIRPQVLIGMDVLRRSSFLIDYRSHRLVFGPPPRLAHSAPLVLPQSDSRFALVESSVRGKTLRLKVDSGCNGLLLYRGLPEAITELPRPGSSLASPAQALHAQSLDSPILQIGAWRRSGVQVLVLDEAPPQFAVFDGLIGATVLSQRRLAFDFTNEIVSWD